MPPRLSASDLDRVGTVFLDDRDRSCLLQDPVEVLTAATPEEVIPVLQRADEKARSGFHVAGYVAYEAGEAFCPGWRRRDTRSGPLVWFGVYKDAVWMDRSDLFPTAPAPTPPLCPGIEEDRYRSGFERVLEYIRSGDIYQCNYTFPLRWTREGGLPGLFSSVRSAHPVGYSAWLDTGEGRVLSFSPELFLRREGDRILARPMKGTAPRGLSWQDDRAARRSLRADPKNRAENIMIVDLMRNDLGRICETGSIAVPRLFRVERYGSVHQMTSDVTGTLQKGATLADVFGATFPPGSVTGAPKIRAVQIIRELETSPRGIYCGAIGLIRPGGDFHFNVAIRTVAVSGPSCTMGVGSGIVADSDAGREWEECLLKGRFLSQAGEDPEILETLRYDPGGGLAFEEEHLTRMRRTAWYFGRPWDKDAAREALRSSVRGETGPCRVRLLLDREGRFRCERHPAAESADVPVKVLLSDLRKDAADVYLYHKTTRREAYDREWERVRGEGYYDAIHLNTRGELTEGCITSVVLEVGGRLATPALTSGLLPGVWRSRRIREGVREKVLTLADLRRARRVWIGNSVRGEIEVGEVHQDGVIVWRRAEEPGPPV